MNVEAKIISIIITVTAIVVIVFHMAFPSLKIDGITVALLVIAIAPWLSPVLKSLEIPGVGKVEFHDIKDATEKILEQEAEYSNQVNMPVHADIPTETYSELSLLQETSEADPNLAVVALRIEIEKRIRRIARKYDVSDKMNLSQIIRDLRKRKIFKKITASGLEGLLALSNKAAHGANVSNEAALLALKSSPTILRLLDNIAEK